VFKFAFDVQAEPSQYSVTLEYVKLVCPPADNAEFCVPTPAIPNLSTMVEVLSIDQLTPL